MQNLLTVIRKFNHGGVSDEHQIQELESEIREDSSNSVAQTIVQVLDNNEVQDDDDFNELIGMLGEYSRSKFDLNSSLTYEYEPPKELLAEFGIPVDVDPLNNRLVKQTKEGLFIEIDDDLNEIGPVDQYSRPLPGHPEYEEEKPEMLVKEAAPKEIDSEELLQNFREEVVEEKPELKTVRVYLPSIGTIEYEVVEFIPSRRSITLVFDPRLSKPPFYPEVGLTFEIEFKGKINAVMYVGNLFDYEGKKFISFSLLEK